MSKVDTVSNFDVLIMISGPPQFPIGGHTKRADARCKNS